MLMEINHIELYYAEFITIALIHFLAVASPGPDFAVTLRESISHGRLAGLWTSLGIGIGIFVHVAYCVLGLGLVISQSILLFNLIKYLGAFYLIYIGISALRSQPKEKLVEQNTKIETPSAYRSFSIGFITNALNPKATLFFLAVFSVTVSPATPILVKVGYGVWMAFATTIWFSLITIFFSNETIRNMFKRFGHLFERTMGAVLIALGIKIALTPSR